MIRMIGQLPLQTKHSNPVSLRSPKVNQPPVCLRKWLFQQPEIASTQYCWVTIIHWSSPTRIQQRLTLQAPCGLVLEPWAIVLSWLCYHGGAPKLQANLHMWAWLSCEQLNIPRHRIDPQHEEQVFFPNCPRARPLENIFGFSRIIDIGYQIIGCFQILQRAQAVSN